MFEQDEIMFEGEKMYITGLLQEHSIEVLKNDGWLFHLSCYNLAIDVGEKGCRLFCIDGNSLKRVYFAEEIQGAEGCCCFIDSTTYFINPVAKKSKQHDTLIEKIISTIMSFN